MTFLLLRRFLVDYGRNGANLLLLVLIPVTFVLAAAPALADASKLLGGAGGGPAIELVTAGWASAFLAAVAMYFQISGTRNTDRRLVIAGVSRGRLGAARLLTGVALAVLASLAALTTLAARGWTKDGGDLWETLDRLDREGCARYVVTDVNKDGMLKGPNLELLREVCARTERPVVASGGVSTLEDIAAIRELVPLGVEGAIVGSALYRGAFTLPDALDVAGRP